MKYNDDDLKSDVSDMIKSKLYDEPRLITVIKDKYINDDLWMFAIDRDPGIFEETKHPSQDVAEYAVKLDGYNLRIIREKFTHIKITAEMCLDAVKSCPGSIHYVPPHFLTDEVKEIAFSRKPELLKDFDDSEIREEFKAQLIKKNPAALRYIKNPDENQICDMIIEEPGICIYIDDMTPKMMATLKYYHPSFYDLFQPAQNL